ncbi:hypothetical protein LguiA_002782 [Lonicera macranthoides]
MERVDEWTWLSCTGPPRRMYYQPSWSAHALGHSTHTSFIMRVPFLDKEIQQPPPTPSPQPPFIITESLSLSLSIVATVAACRRTAGHCRCHCVRWQLPLSSELDEKRHGDSHFEEVTLGLGELARPEIHS